MYKIFYGLRLDEFICSVNWHGSINKTLFWYLHLNISHIPNCSSFSILHFCLELQRYGYYYISIAYNIITQLPQFHVPEQYPTTFSRWLFEERPKEPCQGWLIINLRIHKNAINLTSHLSNENLCGTYRVRLLRALKWKYCFLNSLIVELFDLKLFEHYSSNSKTNSYWENWKNLNNIFWRAYFIHI